MFEERKLEWMAPMAGGWGGGGGGGIGAGDPTITNEGTATDGQVLTANGDGTFTFESPTVGGLLTPNGVTAVEKADVYPVEAYGASGSDRMYRCTTSTSGTTTVTTKNSDGTAIAHDFAVGQQVVLMRCGALPSISAPVTARGSATQAGTTGATAYKFGIAAGDGAGAWTAVATTLDVANGNATVSATNYIELKIPVPYGACSVAIYGPQTENRTLLTVLETSKKFWADGTIPAGGSSSDENTASISNSGGFVLITTETDHGLEVGDPVNFHSRANTEYNGQHVVTAKTDTTLTTSTAYGSAIASGWYEQGFVTWRYKGNAVALHDRTGLVDCENPPWAWRASVAVNRGDIAIDTVGGKLYRSIRAAGSRFTAAVEPTWPADESAIVMDGDHTRKRTLDFVPVAEPAADVRSILFTTVASVPTSSTFTLTDAAAADIASVSLLSVAHNEVAAFDAAFAAAEASGKGGTVTASGTQNLFFKKHSLSGSGIGTNIGSYTAPVYAAFSLRSGVENLGQPAISVKLDPHCVVRAHFCQVGGMIEDIAFSENARSDYYLFHLGGENITITGGAWEWQTFAGGRTEHECANDSHAMPCSWSYDQNNPSAINLGTTPLHTLIADCRIDWPSIGASNGYEDNDDYSYRKLTLRRVQLHYGGSDGDQTFSTSHGDFDVDGCEIWNTQRLGSHGFYLGSGRNRHRIHRTTFKEIYKNSVQMRGTGGDGRTLNTIITDCIGVNGTGPLLVGDQTTSNRVVNVAIANCHGFSITLAEARNVSIVGGTYGTIATQEDVQRLKIADLTVGTLSLSATDSVSQVDVRSISANQIVINSGLADRIVIDGVETENSYESATVYNGYLYEWIATGTNNEYYCRLRSTGGNPSISSPTAVIVRGNITNTAGSLGSLSSDTWFWGYPDGLGGAGIAYQTLVVKTGDSLRYDPDNSPYGDVQVVTLADSIAFGGVISNAKFRNIHHKKTLAGDLTPYWGNASGTASSQIGVLYDNVTFEHTGLAYLASGTCRMLDWGTAVMPRCEIEFFKCKWLYPARIHSAIHSEVRMAFTRGGWVTFRECEMPCWGATHEILGPAGSVHLIGNKVQSDEAVYTCATAGNTFTHVASGNTLDLGTAGDSAAPVMVRPYGHTAMPSPLTADTIYYRNPTTRKLYATASDASGDTSAIDITTGDGLNFQLKFLHVARLGLHSNRDDFLGDMTTPDLYGEVRNNLWRGSPVVRYATITSNQSNYQLLPLLNKHRIATDASREIDGFNAPGAGNTWREDQLWNAGSNDVVIKDDTDTDSVAQNRIANHTNADITVSAGEFMTITYDVISQVWRTIGYTP